VPINTTAGLTVFTALLAGLTLGCTAHKEPSRIETILANMAKDVVIPIEAMQSADPLPASREVVGRGHQVYLQSCALCHGTDGRGRTDLGRAMYPPAMDLNSPHAQHWNDAELFWIIQNGIRLTGMPSWKSTISDTGTWQLVQFLRALPRLESASKSAIAPVEEKSKEELIAYGRTLYRQEGCFGCHQLDGAGGKIGPDLTVEGTRGRTDEWLIGHFKDPTKYVPGSIMFSYKNLMEDQLRALTTFLQSEKGPNK
jgi:mono/diheme cytochrome c family protein